MMCKHYIVMRENKAWNKRVYGKQKKISNYEYLSTFLLRNFECFYNKRKRTFSWDISDVLCLHPCNLQLRIKTYFYLHERKEIK